MHLRSLIVYKVIVNNFPYNSLACIASQKSIFATYLISNFLMYFN